MSAEEIERAKRVIQTMRLPIMAVPTRRFSPHAHGPKVDMRRTPPPEPARRRRLHRSGAKSPKKNGIRRW